MTSIDPLTALLKGKTLYSPADKIYCRLYKSTDYKANCSHSSNYGQLMIAHDDYREYAGDYGEDIVFSPANSELLIAILAEGAWEVLE